MRNSRRNNLWMVTKNVILYMLVLLVVPLFYAQAQVITCEEQPWKLRGRVGKIIHTYPNPSGFSSGYDWSFNNTGTKLYLTEADSSSNIAIRAYTLSTPYEPATAISSTSTILPEPRVFTRPTFKFSRDGTKLFVLERGSNSSLVTRFMFEYALSTPYDTTTATYTGNNYNMESYMGTRNGATQHISFNGNGDQLILTVGNSKSVYIFSMSTPYSLATMSLDITYVMSSGWIQVEFANNGTTMFLVEQRGSSYYLIKFSLSTPYSITSRSFVEEIRASSCYVSYYNFMFDNTGRRLFALTTGTSITRICEFFHGYLSYSENFTSNNGSIANNISPIFYIIVSDTFADANNDNLLDGGITINNLPAGLSANWVLSDNDTVVELELTGAAVNHQVVDTVSSLNVSIDGTIASTSGSASVTLSCPSSPTDAGISYYQNAVISCTTTALDYQESMANNGTIETNVNPLTYTITTEDRFVDANNDNRIDGGVIIDNLPPGLTATWELFNDDREARLVLSGTATAHKAGDSVAALNVAFTDASTSRGWPLLGNTCSFTVGALFLWSPSYMRHGKYFSNGQKYPMTFGKK